MKILKRKEILGGAIQIFSERILYQWTTRLLIKTVVAVKNISVHCHSRFNQRSGTSKTGVHLKRFIYTFTTKNELK